MAYGLTQSLDLERSSAQYATISDAAQTGLDFASDFTIECWINIETLPSSFVGYTIASKFTSGNRQYHFYIYNTSGTYSINCEVANVSGTCNNGAGAHGVNYAFSAGVWYHVAMVKSGTQVTFFIDGSQVGSAGGSFASSMCNGSADFDVGRQFASSTSCFDGKISLMRLWSVARTGTQLNDNKCNVLGATTNLVAEWTFDGVYTDNSGNGNTLTPQASPVFASDVPSVCTPSTTVKTYTGVTTASVKTVLNGTAIANRKTWNGIS